ncbi:MAG: 3'-5' exonuclease [Desulfobulbus propionicus]|nr:MAG: 3'-5' exonuclease [Desulfobulbus propionicus]
MQPANQPDRLDKEAINALPLRAYEGPIRLICDSRECQEAMAELSTETALGFDTETQPAFKRGRHYPPALLQLAGTDTVYLFQLSRIGLLPELCSLLARADILKAGVGVQQDLAELRQVREFTPQGFVNLARIASKAGLKNQGLRGLTALLLGFRISKGARTSNWGRQELSLKQLTYAATDAWVGREIFFALRRRYPHLFTGLR